MSGLPACISAAGAGVVVVWMSGETYHKHRQRRANLHRSRMCLGEVVMRQSGAKLVADVQLECSAKIAFGLGRVTACIFSF